ncbi:MAG: photosynthetic reaction center cytochrome PufC [Oceanicaulis sp.]
MKRDPQGKRLFFTLVALFGGGGLLAVLLLPDWDSPPMSNEAWVSEELGPAAISMYTLNARTRRPDPLNELEFPVPPLVEDAGVTAGEVYDDVQVLGDLDRAQFDRLQVAITRWVAPNEGCTFCHAEAANGLPDFDAEPPYQFDVAREMMKMVRELNAEEDHIRPQGVTCFTCHRGQNVPEYGWYKAGDWPGPEERWYQEPPPWIRTATTIRDFFPREAFELFLLEDDRAAGLQARDAIVPPEREPELPPEEGPVFTRAENTYLLMMQMSDALGQNCTFCHNTRAFYDWEQSTPYRVDAFHAIHQTRRINRDHIEPLADILPEDRLGPVGDPFKANCMSCHVGERKPLGGVPMLSLFPGLVGETPEPETARPPRARP